MIFQSDESRWWFVSVRRRRREDSCSDNDLTVQVQREEFVRPRVRESEVFVGSELEVIFFDFGRCEWDGKG